MRLNELLIDFPFLKCRINAGTRYTNMKVFFFYFNACGSGGFCEFKT